MNALPNTKRLRTPTTPKPGPRLLKSISSQDSTHTLNSCNAIVSTVTSCLQRVCWRASFLCLLRSLGLLAPTIASDWNQQRTGRTNPMFRAASRAAPRRVPRTMPRLPGTSIDTSDAARLQQHTQEQAAEKLRQYGYDWLHDGTKGFFEHQY